MTAAEPVTGIVLSGGSAYGAYEVGVMLALFTGNSPQQAGIPVEPQIFAGTSSGGVNAAWMTSVSGLSFGDVADTLRTVWLDGFASHCGGGAVRYRGNPLEFFDPDCYAGHPAAPFQHLLEDTSFFLKDWSRRALAFVQTQASLRRRALELIDLSVIVSVDPLRELLSRELSLENIRKSGQKLLIAATNWSTGELRVFRNEDMTDEAGVDIVMASAAFPGLDPVYIGGVPYVDGGYVMNSPLSPLIDAGADIVHFVYMDPTPAAIPVRRLQNTVDLIDRMFVILRAAIFNRDIEVDGDINRGLTVLENSSSSISSEQEASSFVRSIARIKDRMEAGRQYRKITIHRYHPSDDLGGVVGLLNFDRDQISHLIDRGYQDAASHNCVESNCVLPG
jgi:predicted acylesterase/phospholipase RssA